MRKSECANINRLFLKYSRRDFSFKMGLEIGMMSKHKPIETTKEETLHFFFTFKYINFN